MEPTRRTFADSAYQASRVDLADETTRDMASHLKAITPTFGDKRPGGNHGLRRAGMDRDTQAQPRIASPLSGDARAVLDFAGIDPNPARNPRVKLPREEDVCARRHGNRLPQPARSPSPYATVQIGRGVP